MNHAVIRAVVRADVPLIAKLVNSLYKVQRPDEFFAWQWFNDEYESVLSGAFAGDELIGTFGVQKKILSDGVTTFGYVTNLNVSAAWQGRGYLAKIGAEALAHFQDLDFLCVFANKAARGICERSFGLKDIGGMHLLVLDATGAPPAEDDGDAMCEPITPDTIFPAPRAIEGKAAYKYTPSYRRWRFGLNPLYKYHAVHLASGEFVVVKLFADPVTREVFGDIVDLDCSLTDVSTLRAVYCAAVGMLRRMGAEKISTWAMPATPLRGVVDGLGFRETEYQSYYCLRILNPACEQLSTLSSWHLREADATNY